MKQIKKTNVNKTVNNFTIKNATDSNSSISTIESNGNSKDSDTSYLPSTSDDNKSSSLKKKLIRGRDRNQINYIRPNFLQNLKYKNNTSITSPTSEIQNRKLCKKNKIILHKNIFPRINLYPSIQLCHIQINNRKYPTNNITNSKIIKSAYSNIEKKYATPVHYDSINSKTTNNKRHNNNHDRIYSTKTTKNTQQNHTNISPLEHKKKLATCKYRSKINKHVSTIESHINTNLNNNK